MKKRFTMMASLLCLASFAVRAEEAPPQTHGLLKKGFYFETEDKDFSLAIAPELQLRLAYANREGAANDAVSFMARRIYIGFGGSFLTPDLTYQITLNASFGGTPINLLHYAYLNYMVTPAFQIRGGLHKVAFNRQEFTGHGKQQFVDRPLASERFNMGRGLGVVVWGTPFEKKMEYYLTVDNGRNTAANLNANQELGYVARLVYNPLGEYGYSESDVDETENPALTIGVAGEFHKEETTTIVTQDGVLTGAFDTGFKWKGLSAQGEFLFRNSDPSGAGAAVQDMGYTFQVGYFLVPHHFELAARASATIDNISHTQGAATTYVANGSTTNFGGVNDGVDETGDFDNEYAYTLGANYFFKGHNLKLQAEYTYMLDGQAGADDTANHIGMVQTSLAF